MDIEEKEKGHIQPFHVFLDGGKTVPIEAAGFTQVITSEDQIIFHDASGAPIKEIFCRAEGVHLIVPDSRVAKTHAFIDLSNKVDALTERIDRIEAALNSAQSSDE